MKRSIRSMLPYIRGRKGGILAVDLGLAAIAQLLLVYVLLRFRNPDDIIEIVSFSILVAAPALFLVQAHSQVWHRVSMPDLIALVQAAGIVATAVGIASLMRFANDTSIRLLIGTLIILTAAWSGPRVLVRLWREYTDTREDRRQNSSEPVVLYGSGPRADHFLRVNERTGRYHVIGIFHDKPQFTGRRLRGVATHGSLERLPEFLRNIRARGFTPLRLIVSEDNERPDELAAGLDAAAACGLRLARLPSMGRLLDGIGGGSVTPVSIEDILHREPIRLPYDAAEAALKGATVLVTGAGGSIGSELVRQIAAFGPRRLVLVEFSEYNLYQIDAELQNAFPHVPRVTALCDVRDEASLERVFAAETPEIVLHAAALKHVPLLEDHPEQAVMTNILGTFNIARLARDHGVSVMTLVSTDKAVNPTNVMGCTKRWAEMICQAFDAEAIATGGLTRYSCVRFGNVLDSAGSVVPLFRKQIAQGGPVTVTHPDVTRYFMTIPEACELILIATGTSRTIAAPESVVYVLDMGEPVRIVSLAERMIQLHGLRPHHDIEIQIVGLRRGEKLYEELAHDAEELTEAPFPKAVIARARAPSLEALEDAFTALMKTTRGGSHAELIEALRRLVPEFVDAVGAPQAIPA